MDRIRLVLILLAAAALQAAFAKTPAQLKSELSGILPPGMKARAVWLQGGTLSAQTAKTIYGVDSDDGIVRELTPASLFTGGRRDCYNPQLTNDGSRVVFQERNSETIYTVNWEGTKLKKIVIGFVNDYHWDAVKRKDYVLMSESEAADPRTSLLCIDSIADKTFLWTKAHPWNIDPDDGIGISPDGKRLYAFYKTGSGENTAAGCGTVPNGTVNYQVGGDRGCVLSAGPETTYKYMHQLNTHVKIGIWNCDGTQDRQIDITTPIINSSIPRNGCGGLQHQYSRWSNHPDYMTTMMEFSTANPYIIKLSDPTKFVALQDNIGCTFVMKSDLRIAAGWGDGSKVVAGPRPARTAAPGTGTDRVALFAFDGRRISPAEALRTGICVQRSLRGKVLRVRPVAD